MKRAWHTLYTATAGVFHTKHEDMQTGRVWEGIIKYYIGAYLEQTDITPEKRLSVGHR